MVGSSSAGGAQPPVTMGKQNLGQDTRGFPGACPARGEHRRMGKVGQLPNIKASWPKVKASWAKVKASWPKVNWVNYIRAW